MSQELAHEEYLYLYDNLPGLLSMAWTIWQRFRGDVYRIQDELAVEHQAKGLAYRWSMPRRSFYTCAACGHQDTNVQHVLQDAAGHRVELWEEAVHCAREHGTPFPEDVRSFLANLAAGEDGAAAAALLEREQAAQSATTTGNEKAAPDLSGVRDRLIAILKPYEHGSLTLTVTRGWDYGLAGPPTHESIRKAVWFAGVKTTKKYVSYYLMPVYAFPDLLERISPGLRKRMQGKSCWNFRVIDEALLAELAVLTESAYQRYIAEGWIVPQKE
ncbi:MAG TPA: hypothetical protein PKW05_12485 [Anaerolineae bacterium]|nr:hypothetical protein [Anaerolineae bacterium]